MLMQSSDSRERSAERTSHASGGADPLEEGQISAASDFLGMPSNSSMDACARGNPHRNKGKLATRLPLPASNGS